CAAARPSLAARLPVPAAHRSFGSTTRTLQEEKKEEKPAEGAQEKPKDATSAAEEELKKQIAAKDKRIAELQDHYLRALADTENVRQRSKKEVESTASFAIQKFAKDLLETVDILTMAIQATPKDQITEANKALKDLHSGVSMTRSVLIKALNRNGVEEFDPVNEQFDPNIHQALYQVPDPTKPAGLILKVEKTGFKLNGRVLRPAQVGVVKDMSD
ncbi:co-chaperone GrpE, partial [Hyaloraphidium curvatum]